MGYTVTPDIRAVAKLAWKYWRSWPMSIKTQVDIEDVIQGALEVIVRKVERGEYNPTKGAPSTFVCTITTRYCINLYKHYQCACRSAEEVCLDDWHGGSVADEQIRWREATSGVESILAQAGDSLRDSLDILFRERRYAFSPSDLEELRTLVKRNGVRRSDLERVFAVV